MNKENHTRDADDLTPEEMRQILILFIIGIILLGIVCTLHDINNYIHAFNSTVNISKIPNFI